MSEWTVFTLKEHFDEKFEDAKLAVNSALAAAEKAVVKAEAASEKRFEGVNEFRSALADQQRTLIPRAEVEVIIKTIDIRLENLTARLDKSEGKGMGIGQTLGYIIGGIGILTGILALIFK